eukprot:12709680-Heterocapsa_arctica.AAC.1
MAIPDMSNRIPIVVPFSNTFSAPPAVRDGNVMGDGMIFDVTTTAMNGKAWVTTWPWGTSVDVALAKSQA